MIRLEDLQANAAVRGILVELATQSNPGAATHWSTRTRAAELGISAAKRLAPLAPMA